APVDHHGQLHGPGPAVVVEGVEGGPHRAAGEEHVVHQDHDAAGEVHGDGGHRLGQQRAQADVVPVEGGVQRAQGDGRALDALELAAQTLGQGHATRLEAHEDDVVEPVVALDHLVGDAGDGPAQVVGAHDLGPGNENAPNRGRQSTFTFGHGSS